MLSGSQIQNPPGDNEALGHKKPQVRFKRARMFFAAIGGFFDGIFSSTSLAAKEIADRDNYSTFTWLIIALASFTLGVYEGIKATITRWTDREEVAIDDEQRKLDQDFEYYGPLKWGFSSYLQYAFGFVLGILSIPLALLEAVIYRGEDESFFQTLISMPGRLLAAIFFTPFDVAQERAERAPRAKVDAEKGKKEKEAEEAPESTYQLKGFSDYFRMGFAWLAGFIYGVVSAFAIALHEMTHPPKNEYFIVSLLKAFDRFIIALFNNPLKTAQAWQKAERQELEKISNQGPDLASSHKRLPIYLYPYMLYVALRAFITGLLGSFAYAFHQTFFNQDLKTEESLVARILLSPFRFLKYVAQRTFSETSRIIDRTRDDLDQVRPVEKEEAPYGYKPRSFGSFVLAGLRVIAAIILAPVLSFIMATLDIFGKTLERDRSAILGLKLSEVETSVSESFYSSLFFAPLRFLQVLVTDAISRLFSWGSVPKVPNDAPQPMSPSSPDSSESDPLHNSQVPTNHLNLPPPPLLLTTAEISIAVASLPKAASSTPTAANNPRSPGSVPHTPTTSLFSVKDPSVYHKRSASMSQIVEQVPKAMNQV